MDEECLNASKRRKIEETVLEILQASDLETTTEFGVRTAAAERLGFGVSGLAYRRLVGQIVNSFLLSTAANILRTTPLRRNSDGSNNDDNTELREKPRQQQLVGGGVGLQGNYDGKVICELSDKRKVTVHDFNGITMVSIREFYIKDGNMLPERGLNSGLSLTPSQWKSFRRSFPSIQEAIVKLESRLRRKYAVHPSGNLNSESEAVRKQSEAEMTNSLADSASEKSQTEAGITNLTSIVCYPTKRKQSDSEADMRNSVVESAAEKSQTEAGISNLTSIVHPHIKTEQTETDSSTPVTTSNYQEDIVAERKQEAAGTFGSVTTSDPREQIPPERKQTEVDISMSMPPFLAPGEFHDMVDAVQSPVSIAAERKQNEAGTSNLVPVDCTQGQWHDTANSTHPIRLIPVQTARLDGRNYHSWRLQMELFLNQLTIAYVLTDPCPTISLNPEAIYDENVKAEAAVQRWINDDYICHHNILNSLSDNLFQIYSQKSCSARELWEELRLAYNEDFGTKRSQINKYIQFQMVEGLSILEQVQELHKIANSIIACGTWIDENFHVSVIVSKLPPSWKEFCVRLMHEEFLPLNMLLHRIKVEEEMRIKKGLRIEPNLDHRFGMRQFAKKRVCYNCGKEGHISKNCFDRKFEACEKSIEKEKGVLASNIDTKMVEAENTK